VAFSALIFPVEVELLEKATYTTPFATAGEEVTTPAAGNFHSRAPVLAFSAYTLPGILPGEEPI